MKDVEVQYGSIQKLFDICEIELNENNYMVYLDTMSDLFAEKATDEELYDLGYVVPDVQGAIFNTLRPHFRFWTYSGIFVMYTPDWKYRWVRSSTDIITYILKTKSNCRLHGCVGEQVQRAWDEYGGLQFFVVELVPSQLLSHAKKRWESYFEVENYRIKTGKFHDYKNSYIKRKDEKYEQSKNRG